MSGGSNAFDPNSLVETELVRGWVVTDVSARGAPVELAVRHTIGHEAVLEWGGPLRKFERPTILGPLAIRSRLGLSREGLQELRNAVIRDMERIAPLLVGVFPHLALAGADPAVARRLLGTVWSQRWPTRPLPTPQTELQLRPDRLAAFLEPELPQNEAGLLEGVRLSKVGYPANEDPLLDASRRTLELELRAPDGTPLWLVFGRAGVVPHALPSAGQIAVASLDTAAPPLDARSMSLVGWFLALVLLKSAPELQLKSPDASDRARTFVVPHQKNATGITSAEMPLIGLELLPEWQVTSVATYGTQVSLIVQHVTGHEMILQWGGPPRAFEAPTLLGDFVVLSRSALPAERLNQFRLIIVEAMDRIAPLVASVFPHLVFAGPDAVRARSLLAEAWQHRWPTRPRPEPQTTLHFEPHGVATFLDPEVHLGGMAFFGSHSLRRITYQLEDKLAREINLRRVVLELTATDGTTLECALGLAGAIPDALMQGGAFALSLLRFGRTDEKQDAHRLSQLGWLLALCVLKSSHDLQVSVPDSVLKVRALAVPESDRDEVWVERRRDDASRVAMIGSEADCQQRCSFCALRSYATISDGGRKELEAKRMQLRVARDAGITRVQLEGVDPMAYSELLTLVQDIRDLGFQSLTLTGTGRRFANPELRRTFLERRPPETHVYMPLYGLDATVHDQVVGRPGAHAEVMAAIDGLLAEGGPSVLAITTVITAANVHQIAGIQGFASERHLDMFAQLPYPSSFRELEGPYRAAAVSERVVVDSFAEHIEAIPKNRRAGAFQMIGRAVRHPCILHAAEQRTGLPFLREGLPDRSERLAGVDLQNVVRTQVGKLTPYPLELLPCPHASQCAAAQHCPREMFGAYVTRFGIDEFSPVPIEAMPLKPGPHFE